VGKQATIETSKGTLVVELFPGEAPKTVANFEQLANDGFYDGIRFHRVIPDFVVQGGCPHTKTGAGPVGTGGPGWRIPCETKGNPHTHEVGALSMAHAGKDTGGSQFFLVLSKANTRHLNGVHTVFGQVVQGLDLLPTITQDDTMTSVRVADVA
jgi:peptidyl-prolyl cis-trans isomerase B (cyclophilin B)